MHASGASITAEAAAIAQSLILPEESEALLRQLARQLEYYFSRINLSKDMYLQTLRDLNDGYVPVTILATFSKVQSLVSYDSVNAVIQAATDYSESLEVVTIDIETRKRVIDTVDKDSTKTKKNETLLAVGPVQKEPLDIEVEATQPVTPFVSPTRVVNVTSITPTSTDGVFHNTIILRDVPSDVTEDQVRALFDFACPTIIDLHLDVASCWYVCSGYYLCCDCLTLLGSCAVLFLPRFVSFDTTSRDDMINIMVGLKSKQLPNGESVKARLKAAPAATTLMPAGAPLLPMIMPGFDGVAATGYFPNLGFHFDDLPCPPSPRSQHRRQSGKRGRKSNKSTKQPSSNNSGTVSSTSNSKASTGQRSGRTRGSKQKKASTTAESEQQRLTPSTPSSSSITSTEPAPVVQQPPPPPTLADDQFPALGDVVLVNTDEMRAAVEQAERTAGQKVFLEDAPSKSNSVAGDDEEDDERKFKSNNMSDAASTATTTSSSSSSIPKAPMVMGAYAAALLKSPPAVPPAPKTATVLCKASETSSSKKVGDNVKNGSVVSKSERKDSGSQMQQDSVKAKQEATKELKKDEVKCVPAPVVITPPSWGGGRSFADVLRKAESGELLTSS
jgi:hypothetical protein